MARQRVQIGVEGAFGIFRTLLHHKLCLSIRSQRRSETVGKSHQITHHRQTFICIFAIQRSKFNDQTAVKNCFSLLKKKAIQETIKRICVRISITKKKNRHQLKHINQNSMSWLTIKRKLLFNCSYYDKLSGYVYDNFR